MRAQRPQPSPPVVSKDSTELPHHRSPGPSTRGFAESLYNPTPDHEPPAPAATGSTSAATGVPRPPTRPAGQISSRSVGRPVSLSVTLFEQAHRTCPGCSADMVDRGCKLRCPRCGFFLDCSDG